MRGEEMKLSKYNLLVPISNGEKFILFNTFNGSCFYSQIIVYLWSIAKNKNT